MIRVKFYDCYFRQAYRIVIDTSSHILKLYMINKLIRTYPAAVGKSSTPTPKGIFKIIRKTVNPGGPFGARWMGLNVPGGNFGIHGTNNPSSIGRAVSNGCIRLYNKDVIELFNLVPTGTTVKIL